MRQHEYGDPLDILIQREASTCKGCTHAKTVFDRHYCDKGKQYGRRCKSYQEITGEKMIHLAAKQQDDQFEHMTPYGKVLSIWQRWKTLSDEQRKSGYGHPQDVKDFMRTGDAVETMIAELPRHQWWAVWKSQGICTQWNFPNLSLIDALEAAEITLTKKMKINVDTKRYFD